MYTTLYCITYITEPSTEKIVAPDPPVPPSPIETTTCNWYVFCSTEVLHISYLKRVTVRHELCVINI